MSSRKRAIIDSDSSDDEDLEEQLLSLSKKKAKTTPAPAPRAASPSEDDKDDDSDSSTDDGDDEWTVNSDNNTKKEKKKKVITKTRQKSAISSSEEEGEINDDDDDDEDDDEDKNKEGNKSEEEGEISDSSSSSDDGSDGELPAFDDGLDENLMGDEDDRMKLEKMTEKEREQELFNRMEKREALKTRREIQHKLHAERKKEKQKGKDEKSHLKNKDNKAESFSGTISARKEIRKKTVDDKKKSAMDELKQKRLEKKEKMDALIKKKEPLTTKDVYSDDDSDAENDDDDDKEKEKKKDSSSSSSDSSDDEKSDNEAEPEEDVFLETIEQLEQIRLSRHKLEKWVHLPFFNATVTGCFIRMGIGQHDGRSIYRVAEIVDVTETSKIYQLGKTRTNKGLKIRHGLQERIFRMEYISNQPFTDSEFKKWQEEMKLVELPLPTVKHIRNKAAEISNSKNYTYKEDDVEAIILEKSKFRKNPHNYAVKKNSLLLEKALALQSQDHKELEKVNDQLADLEDRAVYLDKQRSGNLGNVSFINERNRKKNVYDAERAVLEEAKEARTKEKNPFTRRRTIPTMITKGAAILEQQKAEKGGIHIGKKKEPEPEKDEAADASTLDSLLFTPTYKKLDNTNNTSDDADLFNIHDFDVQIDVPIPESRSLSLTPKPMVGQRDNISRRSLNLDEYKKRKGLM